MVFQADRSSHQEHLQVAASSTQLCRKANPTFNAVPPSLPGRSMHIYIQFEMFGFGAFLYVDLPLSGDPGVGFCSIKQVVVEKRDAASARETV
jgi:hypothetical protein